MHTTSITSFTGIHRFLSNFGHCPEGVTHMGIKYATAEHAYQAQKITNVELRQAVYGCHDNPALDCTPVDAKRISRAYPLRHDWNQVKLQAMTEIVWAKFTQNPTLRAKLLGTGDTELIEGNWWGDTYWGVYKGKGENHLGKILMETRRRLVEGD